MHVYKIQLLESHKQSLLCNLLFPKLLWVIFHYLSNQMCFKMAITTWNPNRKWLLFIICYCYSCVYVKAAKQYIERCVVRAQKMRSSGTKSTCNRHKTYYCPCSNVSSCIIVPPALTPSSFTLQAMKSWGCEGLGMWPYSRQHKKYYDVTCWVYLYWANSASL